MINQAYPNFSFQTFYVSREVSNCPYISEIIEVIKRFKNVNLLKDKFEISTSIKYGKRILINGNVANMFESKNEDFLEIVDYNPIKKVLLVMGPKEPLIETPIHWLVHHARDEVKAIFQINNKQIIKKFKNKIPTTEKEYQNGTIEQAKEILLKLRNSKIVIIKNQGVIFVGNSLKDIEDLILKNLRN
jgi:ribulose-5-phosphate 4-epimerase/fuculose-1-phosphate aldolase